jgi:predicted ATPase
MHRLKGELLLLNGGQPGEAEARFQRALEVARAQSARSWELRAAMSLGKLLHRQGKRQEARDIVQDTYDWFGEGMRTGDLGQAKALLDKWRDGAESCCTDYQQV